MNTELSLSSSSFLFAGFLRQGSPADSSGLSTSSSRFTAPFFSVPRPPCNPPSSPPPPSTPPPPPPSAPPSPPPFPPPPPPPPLLHNKQIYPLSLGSRLTLPKDPLACTQQKDTRLVRNVSLCAPSALSSHCASFSPSSLSVFSSSSSPSSPPSSSPPGGSCVESTSLSSSPPPGVSHPPPPCSSDAPLAPGENMRFIIPPYTSYSPSLFSSSILSLQSPEETNHDLLSDRIASCLGLNPSAPQRISAVPCATSTSARKRLSKSLTQCQQPSPFFRETGELVVASLASDGVWLELGRDPYRCCRDSDIWRKYVRPLGWSTLGGDENVGELLESIALNIGANSDPILGYGRNRHDCVEWHGQLDPSGYAVVLTRFAPCFKPCLFYTRVVLILLIMYCPQPDIYTYVRRGTEVQMVCNNKACINYWHIIDINATEDKQEGEEEEESDYDSEDRIGDSLTATAAEEEEATTATSAVPCADMFVLSENGEEGEGEDKKDMTEDESEGWEDSGGSQML
eukprot:GHVS01105173.1.p1 GENE.GHVS01105173.1~~GHVS01105173.1.p1  ORF type:complete len:513 (+),score=148.04 GHVS01105173.1:51-1589(+)